MLHGLCLRLSGLLLALAASACASLPEAQLSHAEQTRSTRQLAEAFLNRYLIADDVTGAYAAFADPDFIQHSPAFGNGVAAHRAYFEGLVAEGANPAEWAHVSDMLLVDGDPLKDPTVLTDKNRLAMIMKDGEIHSLLPSLQTGA